MLICGGSKCRIPKHPLGIVKTCEDSNLSCTAYKHLGSLSKPIISRHGMKGGRFIDGMYACNQGLQKIMGISIISDTGINSDHLLVVSKIDLGIETHNPRDKQEERIDFRRILNIPVRIIPGNTHPSLDDTVYKGADYKIHAALFHNIQKIVANPSEFHDRIQKVHDQLRTLIQNIVGRTKNSITIEEQKQGKLITRTNDDAKTLNDASMEFFSIIYDICRKAELSYKAYSTKMNTANRNQEKIASEKIMLTATSYALSKQLDETAKRARSIFKCLWQAQNQNHYDISKSKRAKISYKKITHQNKRLQKQDNLLQEAIANTLAICIETQDERQNHIEAIKAARNQKMYNVDKMYIDTVIEQQGKQDYNQLLNSIRNQIRQPNQDGTPNNFNPEKMSKLALLQMQYEKWHENIQIYYEEPDTNTSRMIKKWYFHAKKAKKQLKNICITLQQVRHDEWIKSKNYYIAIGKYGTIARMVNPKQRTGPTASFVYPTKPGEPIRRAINNSERIEASLLTHNMWIGDPPGKINCHFIEKISDEVGINGISINPDKKFDMKAEWNYLEGLLEEKTNPEIANEVRMAQNKLPILFKHIKAETKLNYPFKFDCLTGEFLYPQLEYSLRKNVASGNGKARASGFAIPIIGRLPPIFLNTYLLKCQIQLTVRLLDIGTECSLRICIGKPCGGVRPLTVGHDDNVFLNGIAQQAIQQEIAKHKILPENVFSYQKGKGCSDATLIDIIVKEIALQNNEYYVADLSDDAEKMFDRLYLDLQIALLYLAGTGSQGYAEWQCANMVDRTNKLVTDIFVTLLQYKCGLPQGNGFSVEIANIYAMILLIWWNMDPIDPAGTIAPFNAPRHGFPLINGGICKYITSSAYVDDAKRIIALAKHLHTCKEFFDVLQGYCDLLA